MKKNKRSSYDFLESVLIVMIPVLFVSSLIVIFLFNDNAKGLTYFALGIALYSVYLSIKSDEKMTANANESFLKIVDSFEDKRIQLLQHPDWLGIEGTIWKCQTYLDRAIKLKKSAKIESDNQNLLFNQFDLLVNRTGLPWGTEHIKSSDIKNIHKMEKKFLELDLTNDSIKKLKRISNYIKKFEVVNDNNKNK